MGLDSASVLVGRNQRGAQGSHGTYVFNLTPAVNLPVLLISLSVIGRTIGLLIEIL